jgi:hypothetical protein
MDLRNSARFALVTASFLFIAACSGSVTMESSPVNGDDDDTTVPPGQTADAGPGETPPPSEAAPLVTVDFEESADDFINPERGFYIGYNLLKPSSAAGIRAKGYTLAIAMVRLDDYRDKSIDAAFLASLQAGFDAARAAGIKVILRFAYNAAFEADASKSRMLGHIAQVKPLLQKNVDVIAVMQAGFIGAWGEWHSSTNGLDNDSDRKAIVDALLDALPKSRAIQVRTPMYKAGIFGTQDPLEADDAFDGSARARVGHHNDCFLASSSDQGTYASPVAQWESFVSQESRFLPMGGETCAVSPRTECGVAIAEMKNNHWSYLNQEYHQDVLAAWEEQGCKVEVTRRLGYRLALQRVKHSESVAPGGELVVQADIANTGFASPYNARPVYVVLKSGDTRIAARLSKVDVRRWEPGSNNAFTARLRVPANLAPGSYTLALWIPDAAETLQGDARYAVRLANDGVWDAGSGDNVVTEALTVDASAPGPVDASASTFAEIL